MLSGGAVLGNGLLLSTPFSTAFAIHSATVPNTLVNVMLLGGADLRFAFVPVPGYDPTYVAQFWAARQALYTQNYPDYATMYAAEYQTVTDPLDASNQFGIHNSCAWLAQQFTAGRVAIIANVYGSLNRRHDHSQLIVDTGDPLADRLIYDREGWGGRLVETVSSDANVVAVGGDVPIFCNGTDASYRLKQVIHARNTRDIALPNIDYATSETNVRNVLTRALIAYYKERGIEIDSEKPADWPYRKFFQHNTAFRDFGDAVDAELATHPLPPALAGLDLNYSSFEQQCRNLYDCCLVPDLLDLKVVSMHYGGWDTHTNEQSRIAANLQDLFGTGGGLDVLTAQLDSDLPGASAKLLYTFGSDFGRQLAANGSRGTDHGRGSNMVLIGYDLNGGVYGDMFPQREALPDPGDGAGRTPFEIPGRDIDGLTSFERVLAAVCDWAHAGSGATVFPNASSSDLETGVDLGSLFIT